MSFFKGLGKVVGGVKSFVEEMEQSEVDRKKKELERLKKANAKKTEKDVLDKELAAERKKLRGSDKQEGSWF